MISGLSLAGAVAPPAHGRADSNRAPHFALPTANGRVDSDSLAGKVVLVDFWASWCGPCRQSFPWMASMHDKYAAKGLVIVAVNLDKDRDLALKFLDGYRVPFTVAFDPEGKTAEAYHVKAMPSSFVLDRTGATVLAHAGFSAKNAGAIESALEAACSK